MNATRKPETTAKESKPAAELADRFIRQAEERGRVKAESGGWWKSIYLTERQAAWFLSLYEQEWGRGRSGFLKSTSIADHDRDRLIVWASPLKNGSLQLEYQSMSETAERNRAERERQDREDAEWEAEHGA